LWVPRLRGITWSHRRAVAPLAGTLAHFNAIHPGIEVEWSERTLEGFEFEPVPDLARRYDLIVLDHPFCGEIAASRCLVPLDALLAGSDDLFVGPSLASYRYDGHIWALPIDAACQTAAARPDLLGQISDAVPSTWDEVVRLGEAARREEKRLAIAYKGVHALMTFFTLCANLGRPCGTDPGEKLVERRVATEALGIMRALLSFCPATVLDWNSIDVHDAMVASDTLVYCPAIYCYTTYAEADVRRPLRFHDLPGFTEADRRGSTIGGTGLGISAYCCEPEAALAYAAFLLDAATQKAFAGHHGQPARVEAWADPAIDGRFSNSFSAIRRTIDGCWVRPRYPGYLGFQRRGGELVEAHLRGGISETRLIDGLEGLHRAAGAELA
jgi:multiple sugar transport system substrate-binding protein